MRIRSIKPEFWRSKTIAALDWGTRLVLKGLESFVDDNGVGKNDLALIAADVFPRDLSSNPRDTLARLSEAISALETAQIIVRYEYDGEDLLYIDRWKDLQRIDKPGKGRFPRPDGSFEYVDEVDRSVFATLSRHSRDTLAPVTGEQGNRGTGEQFSPAPAVLVTEADFDVVWQHWPKKVERKAAFDQFKRAVRRIPLVELSAAVIRFGDAYAATTDRQFVPALGVWLRGDRWSDDLPTGQAVKQPRGQANLDFLRGLGDEGRKELE